MDESLEGVLAELRQPDEALREAATAKLWRRWFDQKGRWGREQLERAQAMLDTGNVTVAEDLLSEAIAQHPDFAEAWNRRAVLYYVVGEYERSRQDCQTVVRLNPHHFGAWHGLGLCHAALGDYQAAIEACQQALALHPYDLTNQRLMLECTAQLS